MESGSWVIAYTEFAAKTEAFILAEVYDVYRLWALYSEMIRYIRALDLVRVLGSRENTDELERLPRVIERTIFSVLRDSLSHRGEGCSLARGQRGRGADYLFCKPHNERWMSYDEAWHLVRALRARLPTGHSVGLDYEAMDLFERELDGDVVVGSWMHDQVIGWDDEFPTDGDHVMDEEGPGSPRNGDSAADATVDAAAGWAGDGDDNEIALTGASMTGADGGGSRERELVSWLGRTGSDVLLEASGVGSERGSPGGGDARGASTSGNRDFQLM